MNTEPQCCYLECDQPAAWELTDGPAPDEYTQACTAHVGALLTDAPTTVVSPLAPVDAQADHLRLLTEQCQPGHVWGWTPGEQDAPLPGQRCACGAIEWTSDDVLPQRGA
jgi:hypothetical protein